MPNIARTNVQRPATSRRIGCAIMLALTLVACGDDDDGRDAAANGTPVASPGDGTDPGTDPVQPGNTTGGEGVAPDQDAFDFAGSFVSLWTRNAASSIALDQSNTLPVMIPAENLFAPGLFTWDGWPIRNLDGSIAQFDGWVVYVALSAERPEQPGEFDLPFYGRSTWRYWFTKDGAWQPGGLVFANAPPPLGERQWAGSSYYDPASNRVSFYYTAVGIVPGGTESSYPADLPPADPAAGRPPVIQQMAAIEADVVADSSGVRFENFSNHELILAADGEIYQTFADAITDEVIYGMRDPEYFRDPADGTEYILFTANAAFKPGSHNGVIGLAQRTAEGSWDLLPPIIASPGVSSQLERPHVIVQDGNYYVFFSTHDFTFREPAAGPEGLYGFVNSTGNFRGRYVPLNGTGLVGGNPPAKPVQSYSYLMLPGGYMMSYLNQAGNVDNPAGWVGSPGPLVEFAIEGETTRVVEALSIETPTTNTVPNATLGPRFSPPRATGLGNKSFGESRLADTLGRVGG